MPPPPLPLRRIRCTQRCLHPAPSSPFPLPREEGEKFNVWVALLNLEAHFGGESPAAKEAALMEVFQKALPYCNQKKLYMALLGGYGTGG